MNVQVYLDYNATAPLRPEARDAALRALDAVGNPSSVHGFGRRARALLETAREEVAALAGVVPRLVTFTSGGTEANHLALAGAGRRRVVVSAIEHPSVLRARDEAEVIPVDARGVVDTDALGGMLAEGGEPALVSVMAANNETGVIQPVEAIAEVARVYGAIVHVDAVQAAGKLPIDKIEADLITLSGHKIGGPAGAGALIRRSDTALSAWLRGGGQETGLRSGTEGLAAIAGFGAAARACRADDLAAWRRRRDDLEAGVLASTPRAVLVADDAARLANTTALAMPQVAAETLVMAFDLAGVAVSAGSACSSGKVAASHVLLAMGRGDIAGQAIRVSHGWATTDRDIERFLTVWREIDRRLGSGRDAA
jgi:cysteine desulfurase